MRLQGHKNLASVIGAAVHRQTGVSLSASHDIWHIWDTCWHTCGVACRPHQAQKEEAAASSKQCESLNIGCPKMTIPTVPQWWFHGHRNLWKPKTWGLDSWMKDLMLDEHIFLWDLSCASCRLAWLQLVWSASFIMLPWLKKLQADWHLKAIVLVSNWAAVQIPALLVFSGNFLLACFKRLISCCNRIRDVLLYAWLCSSTAMQSGVWMNMPCTQKYLKSSDVWMSQVCWIWNTEDVNLEAVAFSINTCGAGSWEFTGTGSGELLGSAAEDS